jgi:hypothetical protein
MADISNVKSGDIKEISDALESLSCRRREPCQLAGHLDEILTHRSANLDPGLVLVREEA